MPLLLRKPFVSRLTFPSPYEWYISTRPSILSLELIASPVVVWHKPTWHAGSKYGSLTVPAIGLRAPSLLRPKICIHNHRPRVSIAQPPGPHPAPPCSENSFLKDISPIVLSNRSRILSRGSTFSGFHAYLLPLRPCSLPLSLWL